MTLQHHWTRIVHKEISALLQCMSKSSKWKESLLVLTPEHQLMQQQHRASSPAVNRISTLLHEHPTFFDSDHSGNENGDMNLVVDLIRLRSLLDTLPDLESMNKMDLILPFTNIVLSLETTGPITGAALTAIEKLFTFHLIRMPFSFPPTPL